MKTSSKILIALGAGLVVGGVLGILFAPDKGSETRRKMAEPGRKLSELIKRKIKEAKAECKDELSEVSGAMEEALN